MHKWIFAWVMSMFAHLPANAEPGFIGRGPGVKTWMGWGKNGLILHIHDHAGRPDTIKPRILDFTDWYPVARIGASTWEEAVKYAAEYEARKR